MPVLSAPAVHYQDRFIEAIGEFQAEGPYLHRDVSALPSDFPTFVQRLLYRAANPAPDRVSESSFWLVGNDLQTYIGRVSVRHNLTDRLRVVGGHIGYDIRPSMRR